MNRKELERIKELISIEDVEAISSILQEKKKNNEILEYELQYENGKIICVDIFEEHILDAKIWHRIFADEIFINFVYG